MTTTTTERTEKDQKAIDEFREGLLSGCVFATQASAAQSNRFCGNRYRPVMNRDAYSHYVTTIGRMARESDALAQLATKLIGAVNLYGTNDDALYQAKTALFSAISEDYVDVVGLSGPDPGRRSDRTKPHTLRTRALVLVWLAEALAKCECSVPGVGWCLAAVCEDERIHLSAQTFPSLHLREG